MRWILPLLVLSAATCWGQVCGPSLGWVEPNQGKFHLLSDRGTFESYGLESVGWQATKTNFSRGNFVFTGSGSPNVFLSKSFSVLTGNSTNLTIIFDCAPHKIDSQNPTAKFGGQYADMSGRRIEVLIYDSPAIYGSVGDAAGQINTTPPAGYTNNWHRYALTGAPGIATKLYYDGTNIATGAANTGILGITNTVRIGYDSSYIKDYGSNLVSEAIAINRILSPSEIRDDFEKWRARKK